MTLDHWESETQAKRLGMETDLSAANILSDHCTLLNRSDTPVGLYEAR
jgi:hypothetical protein